MAAGGGGSSGGASASNLGLLRVRISGWEKREDDSATFVVYQVQLRSEAGVWSVLRRYSQFLELCTKLQDRFPGRKWVFPKKKMTGNLDLAFITERSKQLETFLSELVQDPEIIRSPEFRAFIDANLDVTLKRSKLSSASDASRKRATVMSRKVAVLGFMGVGKSAVSIQFAEGHFPEIYSPTIENTFHKIIKHRGVEYATDILDTAGQDEYQFFHARYAMGIHGYVLLYTVTLRRSFEMAKNIHEKLVNAMGTENIPKILVGSKRDLIHERQVSEEEGQKLADEWGCPFLECSAKYNENIGDIFYKLIAEIDRMNNVSAQETPESCVVS